jgi:RNA polymerase primary sigma factor
VKEITTEKTILTENSKVLKQYFESIAKFPVYSPEEQIELAKKMKNGDMKARTKLINSNLRFVVTCAKKYTGQGIALIDLIQAGMLGLVQSFENFDPDKGYKFLSFAVWYIRREILKEIYNTRRTIRYPITYISKITKVKKIHDSFVAENKREPTEEELLQLTNITQEQYNSTILNKSYCQSINTPLKEDSNTTLEETIPDIEDKYSDVFTKDAISKALKCLNPREYTVITKYYGLDGEYNYSIKEIAKELGICDERVRQLRKGAVKKLKQRYGNILKTLLE